MNENLQARKRTVVVALMLLIAATFVIHPGGYLHGEARGLYASYFADLVMPFGFYFLLRMPEADAPVLRRWQIRAAIAFLVPAIAEILQGLGIRALGTTFDAWDFLAYAVGVSAGALVDRRLFPRIFPLWGSETAQSR